MSTESQSTLEQRLAARTGLALDVAVHLRASVARRAGLAVICGPAGHGKTTVAEILAATATVEFLGDLRMPDEIRRALVTSAVSPVVAVVRSGQSRGLFRRWDSMGIESEVQQAGRVTVVTLRLFRPAPAANWPETGPRPLIAEVLMPDGAMPSGTLVDQARTLIQRGVIERGEANRFGYSE
jgi:hypothetical protein